MDGRVGIADLAQLASTWARASACWSPALAPQGHCLAYISDRTGEPRLWLRALESERELRIDTGPALPQHVSWSADGAWLALLAAPGGSPRTQVWLVRSDGSGLHRVDADPACAVFLGPWTHRPGLLALAVSASASAPGQAFLYDARTRARVR